MNAKTQITIIEISGIAETADKTVTVVDAKTGKALRLPRSQIDFMPGRVVLPVWLKDKIFKHESEQRRWA